MQKNKTRHRQKRILETMSKEIILSVIFLLLYMCVSWGRNMILKRWKRILLVLIYLKLEEAGTGVEQFASNQGYERITEGELRKVWLHCAHNHAYINFHISQKKFRSGRQVIGASNALRIPLLWEMDQDGSGHWIVKMEDGFRASKSNLELVFTNIVT